MIKRSLRFYFFAFLCLFLGRSNAEFSFCTSRCRYWGKSFTGFGSGWLFWRRSVKRVWFIGFQHKKLCVVLLYIYSYSRYSDEVRAFNILVSSPEGVTCLTLERDAFNQLISGLRDIELKVEMETVEANAQQK